ncbi:MAG: hypothetical protein ACLFPV_01900 [Spirochaetaceae bacterium]
MNVSNRPPGSVTLSCGLVLALIAICGPLPRAFAESRVDLSRPVPAHGELFGATEISGSLAPGLFDRSFDYDPRPGSLGGSYWQLAAGLWAVYGVSEAVALGLDFSPGGVIISRYADEENRRRGRLSDLVLSARFELLGDDGLVGPGRRGRTPVELSVGPRIVLAMPAPDYATALENRQAGERYVAANQDLHAWGAGIGLDLALSPSPDLSLRTSHQLDIFLPAEYDSAGLSAYEENEIRRALTGVEAFDTIWYRYRYRGAAGVDRRLSESWDLQPLTLEVDYLPPPIVDDLDPLSDTDSLLLRGGIGAEARIPRREGKAPILFRSAYYAPLLGKNRNAEHTLMLSLAFKLL